MARTTTRGRKRGKATKTAGSKAKASRERKAKRGRSARPSAVRQRKTGRPARRGSARKGRRTNRSRPAGKKARGSRRPAGERRGQADFDLAPPLETRGLGPEAAGQAGDTEGLSRAELADSESVEELIEEGQAFEAGVVSGVEDAPDADAGEVQTREIPEDDVPEEYRNQD